MEGISMDSLPVGLLTTPDGAEKETRLQSMQCCLEKSCRRWLDSHSPEAAVLGMTAMGCCAWWHRKAHSDSSEPAAPELPAAGSCGAVSCWAGPGWRALGLPVTPVEPADLCTGSSLSLAGWCESFYFSETLLLKNLSRETCEKAL